MCHLVTIPSDCCPRVECQAPTHTNNPGNTPPLSLTTQPSGPCTTIDKLANCNQYDKATACVGQYEAWARDNCPVYCGYCREFFLFGFGSFVPVMWCLAGRLMTLCVCVCVCVCVFDRQRQRISVCHVRIRKDRKPGGPFQN